MASDTAKLYKETNEIISNEVFNGLIFNGFTQAFAEAIIPSASTPKELSPMDYFGKMRDKLSHLLHSAKGVIPKAEDPTDIKSDDYLFTASKKRYMSGVKQIEGYINGIIAKKNIGDKIEFRTSVETATSSIARSVYDCLEISYKCIQNKGVIGRIVNLPLSSKIKSYLTELSG